MNFYEFVDEKPIKLPEFTWKWDVLGEGTIIIEGIKRKPLFLTRLKTALVLGSKWTKIQTKEAKQ